MTLPYPTSRDYAYKVLVIIVSANTKTSFLTSFFPFNFFSFISPKLTSRHCYLHGMVQLFLTACFCSLTSDAFSEVFVTTLGSVLSWSFSGNTSSCDSDVCAKMSKINTMMNEGKMKHLDKIESTYCDHVKPSRPKAIAIYCQNHKW